MLHEMSQSPLILLFQDRAYLIDKIKLDPLGRFRISPYIVGEPIRQYSNMHGRIKGDRTVQVLPKVETWVNYKEHQGEGQNTNIHTAIFKSYLQRRRFDEIRYLARISGRVLLAAYRKAAISG
jgi:hypothetical protein